MDPFACILPELHDWIFHHYNAMDFLQATEVSQSWNEYLRESQVMMNNVKLVIEGQPHWFQPIAGDQIRGLKSLINNTRRYRNVFLNCCFDKSDYKLAVKFLKHFVTWCPTLLELELRAFPLLNDGNEKVFNKFDLPRLKILTLYFPKTEVTNLLLSRCSSLIKLRLIYDTSRDSYISLSTASLRSFVERNQSLET